MSRRFRSSLLCLAVLSLTACGALDLDKGEDPDPELGEGASDAISNKAVHKGVVQIGAPLLAAFDSSSYHLYDLDLPQGAAVQISLEGADDSALDTVLRVYGPRKPTGALPSKRLAYQDDGGAGNGALIERFAAPRQGTYAIVASLYGNKKAPGAQYRLAVSCVEGDCVAKDNPLTPPVPFKKELHLELDCLGTPCSAFTAAARAKVTAVYAGLGIKLSFHDDEEWPESPESYGEIFEYSEFRDAYFNRFGHRGQPGWSYMIFSSVMLDGMIAGWGRLGGDMFVIGPEWTAYSGERLHAELVYIFLHEFGHNMGLTHEGFDEAHPHDYANCTMPSGAGRDRDDMPAMTYCPVCAAHINPEMKPAW